MWLCPLDLPEDEECELPEKEAGILWDAVCFSFLLIQRRIFLSYYHLYVVADRLVSKAIAPRYRAPQGAPKIRALPGPWRAKVSSHPSQPEKPGLEQAAGLGVLSSNPPTLRLDSACPLGV